MPGPQLETERLILRPPIAADFEPYAAFMADGAASHFVGGPQVRSLAWRGFAAIAGSWGLYGYSMFSILEKASGLWVGRGGPWFPDGWPAPEVGYAIVPAAQRRGYAREAMTAAIDWAFDELRWDAIIHCIDPNNRPSLGVARSLGSRLQRSGVRAPPPIEATWDIYGQTREEWRSRGGKAGLSSGSTAACADRARRAAPRRPGSRGP